MGRWDDSLSGWFFSDHKAWWYVLVIVLLLRQIKITKGNLRKNESICAYPYRQTVNNGGGGVATDCWGRKTGRDHIFNCKPQTKGVDSTTICGPNIQIPEPMENIRHSNINMVFDSVTPRRQKPQSPICHFPSRFTNALLMGGRVGIVTLLSYI